MEMRRSGTYSGELRSSLLRKHIAQNMTTTPMFVYFQVVLFWLLFGFRKIIPRDAPFSWRDLLFLYYFREQVLDCMACGERLRVVGPDGVQTDELNTHCILLHYTEWWFIVWIEVAHF